MTNEPTTAEPAELDDGTLSAVSLSREFRSWWSTFVVVGVIAFGPLGAGLVARTELSDVGSTLAAAAVIGVVWLVVAMATLHAYAGRDRPVRRWSLAPVFVQRWATRHVEQSVFGAGDLKTWTATNPGTTLDQLIEPPDDAPELPLLAELPFGADDERQLAEPAARPTDPVPVATPVVEHEVKRGDTLWGLAERHLGAGTRWSDIVAVNQGRLQADGTTIDADHELRRGTTVAVPLSAKTEASQ